MYRLTGVWAQLLTHACMQQLQTQSSNSLVNWAEIWTTCTSLQLTPEPHKHRTDANYDIKDLENWDFKTFLTRDKAEFAVRTKLQWLPAKIKRPHSPEGYNRTWKLHNVILTVSKIQSKLLAIKRSRNVSSILNGNGNQQMQKYICYTGIYNLIKFIKSQYLGHLGIDMNEETGILSREI